MNTAQDLIAVPGSGVIVDPVHENYILNIQDHRTLHQIIGVIPHAYYEPYQQGHLVVLPAQKDTIAVLRSQGLSTHGMEPFYYKYKPPLLEGKYKPMAHQIATAAFLSSRTRAYNFSTMRTGKTGATVLTTDYLQTIENVPGAALIVSTVSTLIGVWQRTITSTFPEKTAVVVHGGVGRAARIAQLEKAAHYYIINYDGIKMVQDKLEEMVALGQISIIVLDELTHYGNVKSGRWIAMNNVINGKSAVPYCYGLTGSPSGNSEAVFGFAMMVNPSKCPVKYKTHWKSLVRYKWGSEPWQWKDTADAKKIIHNTLQPAIRYDKKDIMDLPPVVLSMRDCELSPEQAKAYKRMKDTMFAFTEDGTEVEATKAASLTHKLLQIALGTAIGKDKEAVNFNNEPRINTICEIIEEAHDKVVIFCMYTDALNRTVEQLRAKGYTVEKVDGSVTGKKRERVFADFMDKKDPHILVCHAETTAFGTELAAATTIIYNGPQLLGGFLYEQSLERLSSLKQLEKEKVPEQLSIIQLAATAEERKAFKDMDNGVSSGGVINNLFTMATKRK